MQVIKRNGTSENVNYDKILRSITKTCAHLDIDVHKIASKTIGGLRDGVTTKQIDLLSVDIAVGLIPENPDNSKAAACIFKNVIDKEVSGQEIQSFSQCIIAGEKLGIYSAELRKFVQKNSRKLNSVINVENDKLYEYFGLKTVYDRYLQRHPETREVIETPQYFMLRVACGLNIGDVQGAIDLYEIMSAHEYGPSTPTLFNSGLVRQQLSSCYLLDSPLDDLASIYDRYKDYALLSKFAGGLGGNYSRVRASGSLIKGTNGFSNGIVPFIHTASASVAAVNQGGKRKGALAVYLESWHADIYNFLELRNNTGDHEARAHNLNIANWVPDIFMRRVDTDQDWTLISPDFEDAATLTDLYGTRFDVKYEELEKKLEALPKKPKWYKKVKARDLYGKMMKCLAETGNGWMTWKDASNNKANQVTDDNGFVVHSSNLCVTPDTLIVARMGDSETEVEMTIEELFVFFKNDCDVQVLTINEQTGEREWKPIVNVGVTNLNADVIEIWEDDKLILKCTPDHLVFTENRGQVRAVDLTKTDKLIFK